MDSLDAYSQISDIGGEAIDKLTARIGITRLTQAVTIIREVAPDIGIQAVHILLEVAKKPGIKVSELITGTGLSQSSCSRNLALLSDQHRLGKPGLNLVYTQEDPSERRRKLARLTPKGEELVSLVVDSVR